MVQVWGTTMPPGALRSLRRVPRPLGRGRTRYRGTAANRALKTGQSVDDKGTNWREALELYSVVDQQTSMDRTQGMPRQEHNIFWIFFFSLKGERDTKIKKSQKVIE